MSWLERQTLAAAMWFAGRVPSLLKCEGKVVSEIEFIHSTQACLSRHTTKGTVAASAQPGDSQPRAESPRPAVLRSVVTRRTRVEPLRIGRVGQPPLLLLNVDQVCGRGAELGPRWKRRWTQCSARCRSISTRTVSPKACQRADKFVRPHD